MTTNSDFLSCDWGTTSFRLRWVSGTDGEVLREIREKAGVKSLYEEATRAGGATETARSEVFARFLSGQLEQWAAQGAILAHPLPLVISGMASSSVGWRELPYAEAPFQLDGQGLRAETLHWTKPPWVGTTHLISGIRTRQDIMRGEEIEIIGLLSDASLARHRERCLLILPGTHSKHVSIRSGAVVDFRTVMTGELFDVLARHSLLRASVEPAPAEPTGNATELAASDRAAFAEGVTWARERGLAGGLFRVRTRTVLDHRPPPENTWFFSGLLIGAELSDIARVNDGGVVILAATGRMSELYGIALEMLLGSSVEWIRLAPAQVERATVLGHAVFLRHRREKEAG